MSGIDCLFITDSIILIIQFMFYKIQLLAQEESEELHRAGERTKAVLENDINISMQHKIKDEIRQKLSQHI